MLVRWMAKNEFTGRYGFILGLPRFRRFTGISTGGGSYFRKSVSVMVPKCGLSAGFVEGRVGAALAAKVNGSEVADPVLGGAFLVDFRSGGFSLTSVSGGRWKELDSSVSGSCGRRRHGGFFFFLWR